MLLPPPLVWAARAVEAVMEKRLAEMSDTEIEEILSSGKTPEEIYREEKKA